MKVICYGDSNTFGYDPRSWYGGQYVDNWVDLLADKTGWQISNLGENGRGIPRLTEHFPEDTDLLIIMLGTNDLLQQRSPKETAERMERFLTGLNLRKNAILLIAPPPMQPGEWVPSRKLIDASVELALHYQALAQRMNVRYSNAGNWNVPLAFDGVHFTQEGHRVFAEGLYREIAK